MKAKHYIAILGTVVLTVVLLAARKTALLPEEAEKIRSNNQKIDEAVELVEQGKNPMRGITLLREVIEEDSTNIRALKKLGEFSIQSGQTDKAIKRFERILSLNPRDIDALYYMGHLSAQKGNKEMAITYFEQCLELIDDEDFEEEIKGYLKELKNS